VYKFEKSANRIFPLNTTIDLIDESREAIAKIQVLKFTNTHNLTH